MRVVLIVASLATLLSCGGSPTEPLDRQLAMRQIYYGGSSVMHELRVVVRSQQELDEAWTALWLGRPDPLPSIDFGREMVVISASGQGTCSDTRVRGVSSDGHMLHVDIWERLPDETKCGCISAVINAVHVVAVPRSDLSVRTTVDTVVSCQ